MARTKVAHKRIRIRRWPPRQPPVRVKIKTIMPKQKMVDIKKNGQTIRTIRVRRKTTKFTDRWARQF